MSTNTQCTVESACSGAVWEPEKDLPHPKYHCKRFRYIFYKCFIKASSTEKDLYIRILQQASSLQAESTVLSIGRPYGMIAAADREGS